MALPVVVMDEAGHTGENLVDRDQPVYALAAIRMDEANAESAVTDALGRAQRSTKELKFSRLRRSNVGRRNVLTLLEDARLTDEDAAVIVLHKPWVLAAKLIDELVEPRMLEKGLQPAWYATGAAKNMAHALYSLGPRALGEMYDELAAAFVATLRDYTPEAAATLVRALKRCRIVCRDADVRGVLSVMIDTPEAIDAEFSTRKDSLDPALTALFWQGGHWSSVLQQRFEVVHDDSTSVRRWQDELFGAIQQNMADRTEPQSFELGDVTFHLPTLLDTISFVASHDDARLQVADVLAGSAAHMYAVLAGARRDEDGFARNLYRAGVADLVKEAVGPDPTWKPPRDRARRVT
jgi:hypothetical protein